MAWWESEGAQAALAGAAGGIVRWVSLRTSWREGLPAIGGGALCAIYLGPIVEPLLQPFIGPIAPGGDAGGFASFVVGLAGLTLAGFVIDLVAAATKKKKDDANG